MPTLLDRRFWREPGACQSPGKSHSSPGLQARTPAHFHEKVPPLGRPRLTPHRYRKPRPFLRAQDARASCLFLCSVLHLPCSQAASAAAQEADPSAPLATPAQATPQSAPPSLLPSECNSGSSPARRDLSDQEHRRNHDRHRLHARHGGFRHSPGSIPHAGATAVETKVCVPFMPMS